MKRMDPIRALDFGEFEQLSTAFDREVLGTPQIDPFCSSSAWILAARESFHGQAHPAVFHLDSGFVAMVVDQWPAWGRVLLPMESSWCLACPLAGPDPVFLVREFHAFLQANLGFWDTIMFAGIMENSAHWNEIIKAFLPNHQIWRGPSVIRRIAGLEEGFDGFFRLRSTKFRKNLRRTQRAAGREQISFRLFTDPMNHQEAAALFSTMMSVEERSWKGRSGQGVDQGPMRLFYRRLMEILAPAGRARLVFAFRDERPIGYLFGGIFNRTFRGFQFSFDHDFASLSPGNLLQLKMIEKLCEEGMCRYDLGTDIGYKRSWAETALETTALIIRQ